MTDIKQVLTQIEVIEMACTNMRHMIHNLVPQQEPVHDISISQIHDGMFDINLRAKVLTMTRTIPFSTGKPGRVRRVNIADSSGSMAVVLWNDQTDLANQLVIQEGCIVTNGYAKVSPKGELEIHLGHGGTIKKG